MDVPNARSSHSIPTPRGGGVGIVLSFMVGILAILIFSDQTQIHLQYFLGFLISSLVIAIISFYDDVKNYTFHIKLATQLIAVFLVMGTGIILDRLSLPWLGETDLGLFGIAITFLWILGLTNAYNFMDGVDGLAASTAMIVSIFFTWISLHQGSHFIYLVSLVILAGSSGFFLLNKPPAKIFMGDVGSAFLGFVFACMAIIAARYDMSHTSFLVLPLLLFHFVYDTLFTLLRRMLAGEKVSEAHRTHIYQLLNQLGWSHIKITYMYAILATFQGMASVWMIYLHDERRLFVFIPFMIVYSAAACWVVHAARIQKIL